MAEQKLDLKESSNVKEAFYDSDTKRVRAVFHSGHSGYYEGVDVPTAQAFESSDSPGKFGSGVLKNQFTYTKIG